MRPAAVVVMLAVIPAAGGCARMVKERGHDEVGRIVQQRTGHSTRWEKGPPDDQRIAEWVRSSAARGLTRAVAVEVALVNNPDLQSGYEALGISQADMVQAGLLRNPTLGADLGFGITSGELSELRLSVVQDFLDLFVLPLRQRIAREQFETDTLRVAHQALEVAAQAEKEFLAAQASSELVAFRHTLIDAARSAVELSDRQLQAGNISPLEHAIGRAAYEQDKLELTRQELELLEARERLNRLLGLWGPDTGWRFAEPLPAIPDADPSLEHLESWAVRNRLDLAAARGQVSLLTQAVGLARSTRLFGRIDIGVDAHRDPDGPRVLGPNLIIELPIFDQRQATIARLEAQLRQQERRLAGLAVNARSEVRSAEVRLRAARQTVVHYRDTLLPLRRTILEQTLLHYNGMLIGLPHLLAAKQAEVDGRRGYLEALRDYWMARAELTRAVGGALPSPTKRN